MKTFSQVDIKAIPNDSKTQIIVELKNALKEEFNAWYGYIIVRDWLVGAHRTEIVKTYDELAEDELKDHAYWLMKRISELGGVIKDISNSPTLWNTAEHPYLAPIWTNKHYQVEDYDDGDILIPVLESLQLNIQNEKGAIETYNKIITLTDHVDWVTNSKCKEILADEEEHLKMLQDFVDDIIAEQK